MDSFLEFVLERLSIAGNVTSKAMFGGYGLYLNDIIFGIVAEGVLYLKVGDSNIKDYIQAGMKPFSYEAKNGKPISMSYWRLPVDVLESNEDLPKWVSKSIEVAKTAKPKKSYLAKYKSIKSKQAAKKKLTKTQSKKPIAKKKPQIKKSTKKIVTKKKQKKK